MLLLSAWNCRTKWAQSTNNSITKHFNSGKYGKTVHLGFPPMWANDCAQPKKWRLLSVDVCVRVCLCAPFQYPNAAADLHFNAWRISLAFFFVFFSCQPGLSVESRWRVTLNRTAVEYYELKRFMWKFKSDILLRCSHHIWASV